MFKRAERKRAWIKLAITGPSGSGKTYSALRLAFGLGRKVAMIDTENGSGSLYAHLGTYDVAEITAPFTVQKYREAIRSAIAGGYDVLVIDSLSHEWDGEGGLLDQKDALDKRGGNSFTNWQAITKQHKEFVAEILQAPIHIIATMRSKTEYLVEQGPNGKSTPKKIGLAPVQRDGMEYEFTVVFDVALDHTAAISKDRTGLFGGLASTLTEAHGKQIADWLASGSEPTPEPERKSIWSAAAPAESSGDRRVAETMRSAETGNAYSIETGARPAAPAPPAEPEDLELAAPAAAAPADGLACQWDGCGRSLTAGQASISERKFNARLCPQHQREMQGQAA